MMSLSVTCQNCGKAYRVKEELAGKKFRCQQCATLVSIPVTELLPELDVEALLPVPVPFMPATNTLPMPPAVIDVYPASMPRNVLATNDLPLPLIKPKPKKKPLPPSVASASFLAGLLGGAVLLLSIFVVTSVISIEWGMVVLFFLLLPADIAVGLTSTIGVLRVAYREGFSSVMMCLFVPFYYFYFIVSRWRYTARYGWMFFVQSTASIVVFVVLAIQAPRETPQERHRRIEAQNERILNRSLARSGLVISSSNQSSSQPSGSPNSPVNIHSSPLPQMTPKGVNTMHAKIKKNSDDFHRQMTDWGKENEKRRQQMIGDLEADPIRRHQRDAVSDREPTAPGRESRGQTRSTTEVETISTPATSAGRLEATQTVFVLWGSQWYECNVVDASDPEKPKITYLGWGDSFDEYVSLDRVRIPNR